MVKIGGADYCTFTNNQKKLLHTIFNGGDAGGTLTEGEENFFIWSRLVVPIIAHSPMAKKTPSYFRGSFYVDGGENHQVEKCCFKTMFLSING